jgi:oligoribonuclease NrnB/cAMP/cGMP phosphodiesterase (DHH superfamily)
LWFFGDYETRKEILNKSTMLHHVTHCDADALGCAMLAGPANISYCDYTNVDNAVMQAIGNAKENSAANILISDIAPSDPIVEKINDFLHTYGSSRVVLVDHHRTTAHLSKFPWVFHGADSGSKLLLNALREKKISFLPERCDQIGSPLISLIDAIDAYDTWNDKSPEFARGANISKLQKFLGMHKAFHVFSNSPLFDLGERGHFILEVLDEKEKSSIEKATAKKYLVHRDKNEKTFAILEPCSPVVAHEVLRNPDLDYVAVPNVSFNTVSLYARKSEVHVGEIAKSHGGGGHVGAAGFSYGLREFMENLVAAKLSGQLEVHAKRKAE